MCAQEKFFASVLAELEEGEHYCVWGNKTREGKPPAVRQRFVHNTAQLLAQVKVFQADGYNAFYGMAKFGPITQGRHAANAVALKAFFLDVDCGPEKPYPTLDDGIAALKQFCKNTQLPKPTIVQSGRGAHVYWILDTVLPRDTWKPLANRLKELCALHKFDIDYAVPADAARVLRVPGSVHVKDPANPLPCEILYSAPVIPVARMQELLAPGVDGNEPFVDAPSGRTRDAVTLALMGGTQSRFRTLLAKSLEGGGCAQIRRIFENRAALEEPLWRAGLSIAQQCVDRDKAIHHLSKDYPGYTPQDTERKANETRGPYTCETFRKLSPQTCDGCTHKITSPIQLGKEPTESPEEGSVVQGVVPQTWEAREYIVPQYPKPFFRGEHGGVFLQTKDKDGETQVEMIYPYDFYVVKRMSDPDSGENLLLRLHLPQDGVREFITPLATVMAKDRFREVIAAQGMAALSKQQDALMFYVTKWVEHLQMATRAEISRKQFGWVEDESAIIVGQREIQATKTVYSPPSVPTLPLTPFFDVKGDFHIWKDVINAYGRPGMEDRAFAFFMGFGALLMRFTALDGFLLNLMSRESGSGKTTILHAVNSIYGRPKELLLSPKDTYNARMQRIGIMQNFAVTMDEITNMRPDEMSNQIYDITSGRGKNRLKQHENAERLNHTKWATGLITSSNRSVPDSLLAIKSFPDGELNRILEIPIRPDPHDDPIWSRTHFNRLLLNYGHAIEPYSRFLLSNMSQIRSTMDTIQARVDAAANAKNSERFWSLMVTIAVTGGMFAETAGLHNIAIRPVFDYGVKLLTDTRKAVRDYMVEADSYLANFILQRNNEMLIINGNIDKRMGGIGAIPIREARGALSMRFEPDTGLLYIAVKPYRDDCAKNFINFADSLIPYKKQKAVEIKKKRMAAGTPGNTDAAVSALCFNTKLLKDFNARAILHIDDSWDTSTD